MEPILEVEEGPELVSSLFDKQVEKVSGLLSLVFVPCICFLKPC